MTQIEKIKAEIERQLSRCDLDNPYGRGAAIVLEVLDNFIESLEREHVPENEETGTQEPRKGLHPHSLRKIENPMAWIENDERERERHQRLKAGWRGRKAEY